MWDWITKIAELRREAAPAVLVTITGCSGSTPRELGAKMIVLADGRFFGTIGGGNLENLAIDDARAMLAAGKSGCEGFKYPLGAKTGQCCGGSVEVMMETLNTGPRLYLFGAGHVGQALSRVLEGTPFVVHVVDERAEWIDSAGVSAAAIRHRMAWDAFVEEASWSERDVYVAVMTHGHDADQDIIEAVAGRPNRYVGLIGSRGKRERFRKRLEMKDFPGGLFDRVHCPIGLDIGGKAPQEVAISVAAELLKVHYGR